jgi:hypothetical protein
LSIICHIFATIYICKFNSLATWSIACDSTFNVCGIEMVIHEKTRLKILPVLTREHYTSLLHFTSTTQVNFSFFQTLLPLWIRLKYKDMESENVWHALPCHSLATHPKQRRCTEFCSLDLFSTWFAQI